MLLYSNCKMTYTTTLVLCGTLHRVHWQEFADVEGTCRKYRKGSFSIPEEIQVSRVQVVLSEEDISTLTSMRLRHYSEVTLS